MTNLREIQNLCGQYGKILVTYISMGFGNPYNDPYDKEIVFDFVDKLAAMGISVISLADTVGVSNEANITYLLKM